MARLALIAWLTSPAPPLKFVSLLAKKKINVDIILQSIGREETKDISFTVARATRRRPRRSWRRTRSTSASRPLR